MVGLKVKKGQAVVCFWKHACGVVLYNIFFSTVHVDIEDNKCCSLGNCAKTACLNQLGCMMSHLTANWQLIGN